MQFGGNPEYSSGSQDDNPEHASTHYHPNPKDDSIPYDNKTRLTLTSPVTARRNGTTTFNITFRVWFEVLFALLIMIWTLLLGILIAMYCDVRVNITLPYLEFRIN